MRPNSTVQKFQPAFLVHSAAGALALALAWWLSGTSYVQTGAQFIGPALVIFMVHFLCLCLANRLDSGFSNKVFYRSLTTSVALALIMLLGSFSLPQQAHASLGDGVQTALVSLFCIVILLAAGAIVFLFFWLILKAASSGVRAVRGSDDDTETRFFDFGAVGVATILMIATGLEGLPNTYRFPPGDAAAKTVEIAAASRNVWRVLETATTPEVPLPMILGSFPKPVDVSIDEGTRLGAKRKVMFAGREGAGELFLQVTERTDEDVVFTVLSDTSPYAVWIGFKSLTYNLRETDAGSILTVSLSYDRELSPSWFFSPLMKASAYFAVSVLAKDVKARAEI